MIEGALILVDVQKDFCPGGSLPVPDGDAIVPIVNRLSARFSRVVATRDWHPAGHVSFASTHGRDPFTTIPLQGGQQMLWPDHCVAGTPGAQFHPDLKLQEVGLIIHKGTRKDLDSYSALYENDGQTPTGLEGYLRYLQLSRLYFCGLALDVCVYYSALDAVRLGFETLVVEDACRAVDQPAGNLARARADMEAKGIRFVQSAGV
jgi:nicotinamidase/pyrazinamidase